MKNLFIIVLVSFLFIGCQEDSYQDDQNSQETASGQSSSYASDGQLYQDQNSNEYSDRRNENEDDRGNRDRDREDSSTLQGRENQSLEGLPRLLNDDSQGDAQSNGNYETRFALMGDVNASVSGKTYTLQAVIDYRGIAFPTGYHFDPFTSSFHIQIAGHSIEGDRWNQEAGSIMIQFEMPSLQTTGTYALVYPSNSSGEVIINSIVPSINDTYIVSGLLRDAQIYNEDKTATINTSVFFSVVLVPLYK